MQRLPRAFGVCAFLAATTAAIATDRFYPDKSATSPNGRFRVEAKSLDNAGGVNKAFAKDFVYTLRDVQANFILWTRHQQENEWSPTKLFVDDDMWVTVCTGGTGLLALRPETGHEAIRFDILKQFPETERKQFVADSTAGPTWAGNSHWYFLNYKDRVLFVIRTWWDRRVLADLSAGRVMTDLDADLVSACTDAEKAWAVRILQRDADQLPVDARGYPQAWDALTAAHLTGRMKIKDAIPQLRKLELSSYIGCGNGTWEQFTLRQTAQLALRRLGEIPGDYPGMQINATTGDFPRPPIAASPNRSDRDRRVDLLRVGMTLKEMVETLGHPDACWNERFDFDVDGDQSYTLRVTIRTVGDWQKGEVRVYKIERLTPPIWQQEEKRYMELLLYW